MSALRWTTLFGALSVLFALTACTRSEGPEHQHDEHEHHDHDKPAPAAAKPEEHEGHAHEHEEAGSAAARFEEGRGLELAPATAQSIGLTTARAEPRRLGATAEVTATVFDAGPPARASAFVPAALADEFATDPQVLSVHRQAASALGQVELVLAAPAALAPGSVYAVELRRPAREELCIPRSALLRTAIGSFVYLSREGHWVRVPVQTGAADHEFVAIGSGLAAGDPVASAAVEHLWLTELRLTKGGGHSH